MSVEVREPTASASHASPSASVTLQPLRGFVIAGIAGVFMAVVGALGTDKAPFATRLIYWIFVMETGATLGAIVSTTIHRWGRMRHRVFAEGALITVLISIPLTAMLMVTNHVFFPGALDLTDAPMVFLIVLMVSAIMTALNYATAPRHVVIVNEAPAAVKPDAPRLLARLPLRFQAATIHALEAEDHYLRVHTDQGSELILMRLTDAITELDGVVGARTHRSWWAARAAVDDVERGEARATLKMTSGVDVPVSRTYLPTLRAEGWLR